VSIKPGQAQISLKNQQWQKAISKFLSAALFILMSLFGLLNY